MIGKKRHAYSYVEKKKGRGKILLVVLFFVFLCMLFGLIHCFLIRMYRTESVSMQPLLSPGDCVVVLPFYFLAPSGDANLPKRGDVVAVRPVPQEKGLPFPWNAADALAAFVTFQQVHPFRSGLAWEDRPVIRRLLGLPGDTLYMEDFILYIRPEGEPHFLTEFELVPHEKGYNVISDPLPAGWTDDLPFSGSFPPVTLQENEFFVMSDNRILTNDSRVWGAVRAESIEGKMVFRYWPLREIGIP